jgi:hypothetical protein
MLLVVASVLASAALASAAPAEPKRSLFDVVSRVEVDATGAIVAIEPSATTPPEVAKAVDAGIRKLHFSPPILQGQAVSGATWLRMQVCSNPQSPDHQLAMRFHGNGPDWIDPSPAVYPASAEMMNAEAEFDVELDLLPNGTTKLVKAKPVKIHGHLRDFLRSIDVWADEQRFHPEMVAGQPVGDRIHTTLKWSMGKSVHIAELDEAHDRAVEAARLAEDKRTQDGCEGILAGLPVEPSLWVTPRDATGKDGRPPEARVVVHP